MPTPKRLSYAQLKLQCQAARTALATCERYRRTELIELHNLREKVAQLKADIIRLQGEIKYLQRTKPAQRA
jgi:hypothetical protein